MNRDLPEDLQTSYDALKYLFESTLAPADAEDALADLEVLVAPYRAAQDYVAGSYRAGLFRATWDIDRLDKNPGTAVMAGRIIDNAPSLLSLVLKAQERARSQEST